MRADDFPVKAGPDQFRYPADVIDVGMSEEKIVDCRWRYGPLVHWYFRIISLGHAAVHHDVQTVGLQQMAGTGNAVFSTQMG